MAQQRRIFHISALIIQATIFFLLYMRHKGSENMNDHKVGIPEVIKNDRIKLVQHRCRKILSENRMRTSYIVPENFVTVKR